jgi:hypothetical protein
MVKHLFKKGEKKSKEFSEKLRLRNLKNNPMSNPETIEKMRQTKLRRFREGKIKHPMLGKKHSEDTKKIMSKSHKIIWKDKKMSEEDKKERIRVRHETARKINLKNSCEICNSTHKLERHHWNYDKPLMVNTLCQTCHEIQHVKNFYQSKFWRPSLW